MIRALKVFRTFEINNPLAGDGHDDSGCARFVPPPAFEKKEIMLVFCIECPHGIGFCSPEQAEHCNNIEKYKRWLKRYEYLISHAVKDKQIDERA